MTRDYLFDNKIMVYIFILVDILSHKYCEDNGVGYIIASAGIVGGIVEINLRWRGHLEVNISKNFNTRF